MIDEGGRVVHEVRFPYPIERVWKAIVVPAELSVWLMANDFEPRVGHRFHFDAGPPRGLIAADVLELDAPTRIKLGWVVDDVTTTVTITLHADGDATVLHLEHADLPDTPRPQFDSGWVEKFDALRLALKGDE